jgi:acetoin utilization protein AcuC
MTPRYVGSEIYRRSSYGPKHPLAVPRVSVCTDLVRAMGWLDAARFLEAPLAGDGLLHRFHTPDYVAALKCAEAEQAVSDAVRARHQLGAAGNPVFREMFRRPATSAGGVALACRGVLGGGIVHCPGGGTHHGRPDRASGFCFLNDCVLGISEWLAAGLERIVYLDIDAHHGDGVQDAFHDDARVFTLSVHEAGRWPHTGAAEDRAGGMARNFPVPPGFNDSEMRWLLHEAILPLIEAFRPQAIMLQAGADGLEEDPLARLGLSNNAHVQVVRAVMGLAPRLVVTGGGGYNPHSAGRCWAAIWATLNGIEIPDRATAEARAVLAELRYARPGRPAPPAHLLETLRDPPREGLVRDEVRRLAALALKEETA